MGRWNLPVEPSLGGDKVRDTYVAELKEVKSSDELKVFTERWKTVYSMKHHAITFNKKERGAKRVRLSLKKFENVKTGQYDPVRTYACVEAIRSSGLCSHTTQFNCEAMNICLPMPLVDLEPVAAHYGVGTDLILIQVNGGIEAFD